MTRRFGRNQKRSARAAIAQAEAFVSRLGKAAEQATLRALRAEQQFLSARHDALNDFVNSKEQLQRATDIISAQLAKELPAELLPYAQQLMQASQRSHPPSLSFDACERTDLIRSIRTIEVHGRIELHFAVRVAAS